MAYVHFDPKYAPCGFLVVPNSADPYDDSQTVLIQSDWDFLGVAIRLGWQACQCGGTDGTVDCEQCKRIASGMIAEAYDWIREREGEEFSTLEDYFD